MVIKMLTELGRMEEHRKFQQRVEKLRKNQKEITELKNTVTELKNIL